MPEGVNRIVADSWTPDGTTLVVSAAGLSAVAIVGERKFERLSQSQFPGSEASLSPDGRWVAYMSTMSGQPEIYVERFLSLAIGRRFQRMAVSSLAGPAMAARSTTSARMGRGSFRCRFRPRHNSRPVCRSSCSREHSSGIRPAGGRST